MSAVSVFLASDDEAFGERLAGALAREGKEARLIAGDQADLFNDNGEDVEASIVVWSEATLRLARLHAQARAALENGALIPVSADGGPAPDGFESLPPIDLSNWRGDDEDPRWRFLLEALAIASEYAPKQQAAEPTPAPTPQLPETPLAAPTSTALAPVYKAPSYSPKNLPPRIADGEMRNIPTISQLQALQPLRAPKKQPVRQPAAAKKRRFDPVAVAVVGVMLLCLLTGAAIILAPSYLNSTSPDASVSEEPLTAPAPETPRIELAMAQPETDAQPTSIEAPTSEGPDIIFIPHAYDTMNIEGYGEGDISYPDDATEMRVVTESTADELYLAMLGPGAPGETLPFVQGRIAANGPRTPSLKPAPPAPASMSALLAGMPELIDPATDHISNCASCPDMIALPPGAFMMGPSGDDRARPNEGPATKITLAQGFAIAAREVTFAEWDACVADGGCAGHKADDFGWGRGDQPVVGVSFEDAQNYAAWLSEKTGETYRLPSEAEWEYAARAGSEGAFSFGDDLSGRVANYDGRYAYRGKKGRWIGHPTPASRYPANAFGLFDMHGNVWEWTADCWRKSIAGVPTNGAPRGEACGTRVLKGGAFNTGGWRLRAAHRIGKPASAREMEIGFRVVREL